MNPESRELDEKAEKTPMPLWLALLISLPLFGVGYVIEQTFRWTNHLHGLFNGLFHMAFFSIAAAIYLIPWALIVHFCYRKRKSQRRRTLWMLGPSILMSLVTISTLITSPPNAQKRFKQFAKTDLPTPSDELNTYFSGGGVADYGDIYYLKTTPAEIDRLIREMKLDRDEYWQAPGSTHSIINILSGSPDYKKWEGLQRYSGSDERRHWFYEIITDSTKTQAYIFVGCT